MYEIRTTRTQTTVEIGLFLPAGPTGLLADDYLSAGSILGIPAGPDWGTPYTDPLTGNLFRQGPTQAVQLLQFEQQEPPEEGKALKARQVNRKAAQAVQDEVNALIARIKQEVKAAYEADNYDPGYQVEYIDPARPVTPAK